MAVKLTWDDLLIEDIPAKALDCLDLWTPLVQGLVAPIFMSMFGDWYLRRPDGSTWKLSVLEGAYESIASTPEEFMSLVNTQTVQEEHLLSFQVWQLHERGIIPKPGQCYALAPHPVFTGRIDIEQIMLLDIIVWQNICAQTLLPQPE